MLQLNVDIACLFQTLQSYANALFVAEFLRTETELRITEVIMQKKEIKTIPVQKVRLCILYLTIPLFLFIYRFYLISRQNGSNWQIIETKFRFISYFHNDLAFVC